MGFLDHGGMWSDLIFMSVVVGLVFPYLATSRGVVFSSLLTALIATIIAHIYWAASMRSDGTTGHMFHVHQTGTWYLDLSWAGWMHVFVMTMLLTVMLLYVVSSLPAKSVVAVSLLLTTHLFLAMVQPGWHCTGELWTWGNFRPPLLVTAAVWSIAVLKIRFALGIV